MRIDKETEERKNDVTSLNARVDNEQTERVKADNALDKRVTDNAQDINHETERAKSAETNLNDALEREVDARQDDTRNLENQIDKANNDSKSRDGVLQSNIEDEATKRATEDNKKISVVNVKAAENSHITVKTSNENTENATVTIGDTFDADFNKIENTLSEYKVNTIAGLNQLTGALNNEVEERRNETTALNKEVAKRPTLDKFIAGDNITLTPDVDKTTLTIATTTDENKVNTLINDQLGSVWNTINENSSKIGDNQSNIKELDTKYNSTFNSSNIEERIKAGDNINIKYPNNGESVVISAKNAGLTAEEQQRLDNVKQVSDDNYRSISALNMTFDAKVANHINEDVNINGDSYITVNKKHDGNKTDFNLSINTKYLPSRILTADTALTPEELNILENHVSQLFTNGDNISIDDVRIKGSNKIKIAGKYVDTLLSNKELTATEWAILDRRLRNTTVIKELLNKPHLWHIEKNIKIDKRNTIYDITNELGDVELMNAFISTNSILNVETFAAFTVGIMIIRQHKYINITFNGDASIAMPEELMIRVEYMTF